MMMVMVMACVRYLLLCEEVFDDPVQWQQQLCLKYLSYNVKMCSHKCGNSYDCPLSLHHKFVITIFVDFGNFSMQIMHSSVAQIMNAQLSNFVEISRSHRLEFSPLNTKSNCGIFERLEFFFNFISKDEMKFLLLKRFNLITQHLVGIRAENRFLSDRNSIIVFRYRALRISHYLRLANERSVNDYYLLSTRIDHWSETDPDNGGGVHTLLSLQLYRVDSENVIPILDDRVK
jgi:hypothetical protein